MKDVLYYFFLILWSLSISLYLLCFPLRFDCCVSDPKNADKLLRELRHLWGDICFFACNSLAINYEFECIFKAMIQKPQIKWCLVYALIFWIFFTMQWKIDCDFVFPLRLTYVTVEEFMFSTFPQFIWIHIILFKSRTFLTYNLRLL
jgi:hypothetical protein